LRVTLLPGEMLDPLHPALGGAVDIIVSNPPYVPDDRWPSLPPEVRDHEPREAVCGGSDGLDVLMALLEEAPRWLAVGGWLVVELDEEQTVKVAKLLRAIGYTDVAITADLAGRERIVEGRWIGV
jgi:release factor glutamine methyltransferase